jgi:hypothetical protein
LAWINPEIMSVLKRFDFCPAKRSSPWLCTIGLLALGFLCGCQGVHPYNLANDTAAKTVQTNYNKIDLTGFVNTARTNLETLRQQELSVSIQSLTNECDLLLLAILQSTNNLHDALVNEISDRTADLTGQTDLAVVASSYDKMHVTYASLADYVRFVNGAAAEVARLARRAPPVFDWKTNPPAELPARLATNVPVADAHKLSTAYGVYVDTCSDALGAVSELNSNFPAGGDESVHGAIADWQASMTRVSAAKNEAAAAQAALDDIVKKYTAKARTNPAFWKADYTNALLDIRTVMVTLQSNAFGADAAVQLKLSAVNVLLNAAASGQTDHSIAATNKLFQADIIAASLPKLASDIQSAANAFNTPQVSSLVIEKEVLAVQQDFTSRQVSRRQADVDLSFQMLISRLQELNDYCRIWHRIDTGADTNSPFLLKMTDVFNKPPADTNYAKILDVFVTFSSDFRGPRVQQQQIKSLRNDLYYQEALDADEASLRTWNAIMSTPINQLVAYYGTGFKPAEIADLVIKAAGFSAIAARVR